MAKNEQTPASQQTLNPQKQNDPLSVEAAVDAAIKTIDRAVQPTTPATNAKPPAAPVSPKRQIKDLLQADDFRAAVAAALPRHLTPDRFIRVAITATVRQPELLECSRDSFFLALLNLSQYGIEPDGRRAHLIPFWNNKVCRNCGHEGHDGKRCQCGCQRHQSRRDVQLIIDYKGIAELVRRSGDVSSIHADVVFDCDEFSFSHGSDEHLRHVPNLQARTETSQVIAVYSFVRLKDGTQDFIVLSKAEVEKVRKRSKAATNGPWVTDWNEMAKKTAFRRHSKWLPLSPEVRQAVEQDDEFAGGDVVDVSMLDGNMLPESSDPALLEEPKRASETEPEPTTA